MLVNGTPYRTVWMEGNSVHIIDQTRLPHDFVTLELRTHKETAEAIRTMLVRGAGAIGATAGYALAQAVGEAPIQGFWEYINDAKKRIEATRPTAQNLFYATQRVFAAIHGLLPQDAQQRARAEAQAIADDDAAACKKIGEYGATLIADGMRIQTHCNAGWLAFVDYGSAISPIYEATRQGKKVFVWVDETRPRGQGASLTAWELLHNNIPHTIIADNAAGLLHRQKKVDLVIVGADRITADGSTANKIGTYEKAVCAHANKIPFYVAAPTSTFDFSLATGSQIPIEERSQDEVLYVSGTTATGKTERVRIAPAGSTAYNPAFDVTPPELITGFITEKGIIRPKQLAPFQP